MKKNCLKQKNLGFQFILILILVFAAFFRLFNLKGSLQFQGDQGRDAIIVSKIFRQKDPVFIGPVTSVGNMYLGPLYYYFMLPFLWLSYPSPMGPVYAVAILGIITVFLIYKFSKKMLDRNTALIATFFFAFSSTAVIYTRFSWNPNPAPLLALLMIFSTYKALKDEKYWVLVFLFFSILIQLHYLTILSLVSAAILALGQFINLSLAVKNKIKKNKKITLKTKILLFFNHTKKFLFFNFLGLAILIFSFTPIILFDYKHENLNLKAFQNLLTKEENFSHSANLSLSKKITKTIAETEGRAMHILFEYNLGKNRNLNRFLNFFFIIVLFYSLAKLAKSKEKEDKNKLLGLVVILVYLFTGILGTSTYQHTIFDHYIAYLFPVAAIVYGIVFSQLNKKIIGQILSLSFLILFLYYNLARMPLGSLGWTIDDIKRTSDQILKRVTEGEKYNIVLLSESGDIDGQNYRYFLTTSDRQPVEIEQRGEVETLFIINEDRQLKKVTDSPIYEIVVFPNKKPAEVFEIKNGPEITVLRKQ
ncbi:MAG: glycosyltransferase family 39 protein [Candidatus Woesebacteria bacterium]|jgi:hypothetical protein